MKQNTNEQSCIDLLNRQPFIDRLKYIAVLLSKGKKNACYAINGEWGSGKSFVLDMFEKEIAEIKTDDGKDYRYMLFHYNCWQYDYYEEPLMSIISVLLDRIEKDKHNLISDDNKTKLKNIAKELAVPAISLIGSILKYTTGTNPVGLLKTVSSLGLRLHTKNGIEDNETAIPEFLQAVLAANDAGQKSVDDTHSYDPYYHFKKIINELRSTISSIAEERTILFIVDELDRCLPEYAIKVLERLHHVFDEIKNVQVILAVDKEQLGHTVQQIFGSATSEKQYLAKFIDFEMYLKRGEVSSNIWLLNPPYFDSFVMHDREKDKALNYIATLTKDLGFRHIKAIIEKSSLCHRIISETDEPMSSRRLCVEIFLTLLKHFDLDCSLAKENFAINQLFVSKHIFRNYNKNLTGLTVLSQTYYPNNNPTKYLSNKNGHVCLNVIDINGYILAAYRIIIGFTGDYWLNSVFEQPEESSFIRSFWKLLKTIN